METLANTAGVQLLSRERQIWTLLEYSSHKRTFMLLAFNGSSEPKVDFAICNSMRERSRVLD